MPIDWEVKNLGVLSIEGAVKLYRGRVISKGDIAKCPGEYPIYSSSVKDNGYMGSYGKYDLDEEMITWSVDGGGNFFFRERHKFSVTNVSGYLRIISDKILPKYFFYQLEFLHSAKEFDYQNKAHPSVIKHQYYIPLPTFSEQLAIAEALSDMDSLIKAQEALIEKKRAIKQGAMQELLTGRKRLPGFEGQWAEVRIGDTFSLLSTASNSRAELSDSGEIGYIHYGDIHTGLKGRLNTRQYNLPKISANKVTGIPKLSVGDLIIADASEDDNGIGWGVEITGLGFQPVVAGLHTIVLRPRGTFLAPGYASLLQESQSYKNQMKEIATGVSVFGITKSQLQRVKLQLPEVDEQSAIAMIVIEMDNEIAGLQENLSKTRLIKQGMMQELLTGRIRLKKSIPETSEL